ncbi:hypothetical protein FPZ41_17590, partial [Streptomyces sp. K1PN6]|nr:hypothetical protein [Streptomyces acidicola]
MFSHPQRNDMTYGVNAANGVKGANGMKGQSGENPDLHGRPNVYHPYGDASAAPAYEAYSDPATAHGWQNAYDDTVRMDPVVDPAGAGAGAGA